MEFVRYTENKEETMSLGKRLASFLKPGDVVLLRGDLGAGKTTFVSGVALGLGIEENVLSPTFNILKCYFHKPLSLYHIDAYRLEGQNLELGLEEFIEGDGVCFIEWPDYIAPLLPEEALEVTLTHEGGDKRKIVFASDSDRLAQLEGEL